MVQKPPLVFGEKPQIEVEFNNKELIESAVATALAVSDGIDATGVTVTAIDHEIVLMGTVMWPQEIDRAVEIALSVPGVRKVSVNIDVGVRGKG